MGRVKSLKMSYESRPENCPLCGKPMVVEIGGEEAGALAQPDSDGQLVAPAWQCTACGGIFFRHNPADSNSN